MKKILSFLAGLLLAAQIVHAVPVAPPYTTWRYQNQADCTALTGAAPQDLCKQTDNTLWMCTPSSGSTCTQASDWHQASGSGGGGSPGGTGTELQYRGGASTFSAVSGSGVTSGGNVGIGSVNPQTKLVVNGTATATAFAGPLTGNVTGNASTATALAANGTNCSAGNYPLGVDASGNSESCTAASTGTVTSIATTSPITGGTITGTGTIGINTTGTWNGNAVTATNASTVTTNANLTGEVTSVGNAGSLGSFTSLSLKTALTNETGSGAAVFADTPTLIAPLLGTPTSGVATNITGLPEGGLSMTDITTNNSSTSKHGFLLKLDNNSSHFMNGTGAWSTPSSGGSAAGGLNAVQYNSPVGTFAGTENVFSFNGTNVGIGTTNGINGVLDVRGNQYVSGNLGIGYTSISGSVMGVNGNVGIGVSNGQGFEGDTAQLVAAVSNGTRALHLSDSRSTGNNNDMYALGQSSDGYNSIRLRNSQSGNDLQLRVYGTGSGVGDTAAIEYTNATNNLIGTTDAASFAIETNGNNRLTVGSGGNVGIGTATAPQALYVAGTMESQGFKLNQNASAGYVLTSTSVGVGTWMPAPLGSGTGTVTSITLATPSSTLSLGGTNPVTTSGTINADINLGHTNNWTVDQTFAGNIGIGTTVPSTKLVVTQQSATQVPVSGSTMQIVGTDANPLRITLDTHNNSNASGSALMFRRSRGTSASPSALSADDVIVALSGRGYGTTGYAAASTGLVNIKSNQTFTDANMGTYLSFDTTPDNSVTAAEQMRITGAGNVGIGSMNPGKTLDVFGSMRVLNSGHITTEGVTATGATGTGKFVFDGTPTLVTPIIGLATGTSLTTTGNIGIGTTTISGGGLIVMNSNVGIGSLTPGASLDVQGRIRDTNSRTVAFVITAVTATGDFGNIIVFPYNITVKTVKVLAVGGTNVVGQLDQCNSNGASCSGVDSSDITATVGTTASDDGALSSPNVTAGNWIGWHTTSVSGTNTNVAVQFTYTEN